MNLELHFIIYLQRKTAFQRDTRINNGHTPSKVMACLSYCMQIIKTTRELKSFVSSSFSVFVYDTL